VNPAGPAHAAPPAVEIAHVFNATFAGAGVHMHGDGSEPLYLPAAGQDPARIVYTRDYASSALHEAAHWCLAGRARRRLPDFGFGYVPASRRDAAAQRAFELAEVRTQAIEWFLSVAARVRFHASIDQPGRDRGQMRELILGEVERRLREGLPPRARRLQQALAARFGGSAAPVRGEFLDQYAET
jgi:hypothetical protein